MLGHVTHLAPSAGINETIASRCYKLYGWFLAVQPAGWIAMFESDQQAAANPHAHVVPSPQA